MVQALASPLKWHGGKHYLAQKIVALMPEHTHYVEPYAGGLSVLLAKDPDGVSEVVSDRYAPLANFWAVLSDPDQFEEFQRIADATPFSERIWVTACEAPALYGDRLSPAQRAWAFFVQCRQSLAGRMTSFTGVTKTRTRRGMNNEVSAWLTAVEGLPAAHARLRRVLSLDRPALDLIRSQDGLGTLFYLDPPYLHETRTTTGEYEHEMTAQDHADLLVTLGGGRIGEAIRDANIANVTPAEWWATTEPITGKFVLSGYLSPMYDVCAGSGLWKRHEFEMANHAAGGTRKRRMTECVWVNF